MVVNPKAGLMELPGLSHDMTNTWNSTQVESDQRLPLNNDTLLFKSYVKTTPIIQLYFVMVPSLHMACFQDK